MATYIPLHPLPLQFQDPVTSVNMSGGSLEFFLAGTSTTTELFSDNVGTSIGISITLNSAGMPESGGNTITLFRDQSKALKLVLKNAAGATVSTSDTIPAVASFDSTSSTKLDGVEALADVTDATNVAAAGALMKSGGTMTGSITMPAGSWVLGSVAAGITADVTQTQAQTPLTAQINQVSVCANTNDVVTLPEAVAGREVTIINNGAQTLKIFPAADDDLGAGADTAAILAANGQVTYRAYNAVNWSAQANGNSALTQVSATYTTLSIDEVIEATANTFTVTLITAVGNTGKQFVIKNSGAGAITVDGDGTETIDGGLTASLAAQYDSITLLSNGANWIIL